MSRISEESGINGFDLPVISDQSKTIDVEKDAATTDVQEITFPEGGAQAWRTLAGAVLMQYSTFGYGSLTQLPISLALDRSKSVLIGTPSPTVFTKVFMFHLVPSVYSWYTIDYYVREYLSKCSPSEIGWIGGTQLFLVFASGVFVGRAFDRGYFRHLMILGSLLHAFSFFMLSLTQENQFYQVFLTHGIGAGLASGMTYVPCLGIASHYFKRNRPMAIGIVAAGTALGATLHPIMLNHLFYNPEIGFHKGVRISAALNSFIFIVSNLLMRPRLSPRKDIPPVSIITFFSDSAYVFMVVGGMLLLSGIFFPSFYIQSSAILHGIREETAFYYLSILNGASIAGRLIPAIFAPRLGATNLNIFFTIIIGVLGCCMFFVHSHVGYIVFSIAYGFFSGAIIMITPVMVSALARNVDELGARMGISFAFAGLAALFAQPISGALLTPNFYWLRGTLFSGIIMLCSAVCLTVARFIMVRRRETQIL